MAPTAAIPARPQPLDRVARGDPGERLAVLVEGQLRHDRERRDVPHRRNRRLQLLEVEERLDQEEVDAPSFEKPRLLVEDVVGLDAAVLPLELAQRPDRPADEDRRARDVPRLPGELDAALDDVLEPVLEVLRGQLAAVRPKRVRLDELRTGANEALVDFDDRLGRAQVGLLGAAQARDRGREQRARAPVGHEDAALREALFQPAHARESTAGGRRAASGAS